MFKKLLALFTLAIALVQPVYANEDDNFLNELLKRIETATMKYNQGEKEPFLQAEKGLKKLLEESDNEGKRVFAQILLSEMYRKTAQYKKAKPHLEALIEFHKKNGKKDADLTDQYVQLSAALWEEGNRSKAKHYAGLACDNGEQLGCELYRELNK